MSTKDTRKISVYKRRCKDLPPTLIHENDTTDESRKSGVHLENRTDKHRSRRKHRPSWIDRSLSSRGSRSSINAIDTSAFSTAKSINRRRFHEQAVFSPNVHRKKRVEAPPAYFVQEQNAYFAEVDAFELEEETPPPKERGIRNSNQHDAVIPDVQFFRSGPILEAVQEDTSGESLQDTPQDALSSNRDSLALILKTPYVRQDLSVAESVCGGGSEVAGEISSSSTGLGLLQTFASFQVHNLVNKEGSLGDVSFMKGDKNCKNLERHIEVHDDWDAQCKPNAIVLEDSDVQIVESFKCKPYVQMKESVKCKPHVIILDDGSDEEKAKVGDEVGNLDVDPKTHCHCIQGELSSSELDHEDLTEKVVAGFSGLHVQELTESGFPKDEQCLRVIEEQQEDSEKGHSTVESLSLQNTSDLLPVFDALLSECRQTVPMSLSEAICQFSDIKNIVKLGEGTFGEAFRGNGFVFKIVPMDGDFQVNGEVQKTCPEMYTETLVALTLNRLRESEEKSTTQLNMSNNFIETKAIKVCQGTYDPDLIRAWEDWDAERTSENDHPMIFPEKQLYMLFVLADGGKDLESFVLSSFDEARSLLMQVIIALAVAEEGCEFEHRDLHWGNVLIARKENAEIHCKLGGKDMRIRAFGIFVHIIDFTLSRLHTGKQVLFCDLSADPALFEGPAGDIQAETYRRMLKLTEGHWDKRSLKTNCYWIHYLIDILLNKKAFHCSPKEKRILRAFRKRVLHYDSAEAALQDDFFQAMWVE